MLYPGIITTRLFSEEINFWPKLGIMLAGQYFLCFLGIFSVKKLLNLHRNIA